ncbi:hypothetical protein [Streptomyces sp. NPDC092370]|uniref:hypothetical protein n=1 Tax=Streptomyces sp. NPDC092370 TaxID=3366016 RepID=UPI00380EA3F6
MSVYPLAGTPPAGSYPAKFPYANTTALNDVTSASNGNCTTSYFCTARTDYDGPTGLDTPTELGAPSPADGSPSVTERHRGATSGAVGARARPGNERAAATQPRPVRPAR